MEHCRNHNFLPLKQRRYSRPAMKKVNLINTTKKPKMKDS